MLRHLRRRQPRQRCASDQQCVQFRRAAVLQPSSDRTMQSLFFVPSLLKYWQPSSLNNNTAGGLLNLIPVALQGLGIPIGIDCTPINVLGGYFSYAIMPDSC